MSKQNTKFSQILFENGRIKQVDLMKHSDEMFEPPIGLNILSKLYNDANVDNYVSTIVKLCRIFKEKYGKDITPNDIISNPLSEDKQWPTPYFNKIENLDKK